MAAQENAHGVRDRGRKVTTDRETEPARAHGINDAARRPSDKPSFEHNVGPYLRAGLTLIPLHRHDATDSRGRQRGKSPRDGAWHFGAMLIGREAHDPEMVKAHLRSWAVKGFFTAFMLSIVPGNFHERQHIRRRFQGADPLHLLV